MKGLFRIGGSSLSQHSLAFRANRESVLSSIAFAASKGAHYRSACALEASGTLGVGEVGPEEAGPAGWDLIAEVLKSGFTEKLVVDVGLPVEFEGGIYSCVATLYKGAILGLRPRLNGCSQSWTTRGFKGTANSSLKLPPVIERLTGESHAFFGAFGLEIEGRRLAVCFAEELDSLSIAALRAAGVETLLLPRAEAFELGGWASSASKLAEISQNFNLVSPNLLGCDGGRKVYSGGLLAARAGRVCEALPRLELDSFAHKIVSFEPGAPRTKAPSPPPSIKGLPLVFFEVKGLPGLSEAPHSEDYYLENENSKKKCENEGKKESPESEACDDIESMRKAINRYIHDTFICSKASGFCVALSGGADSALTLTCLADYARQLCNNPSSQAQVLKNLAHLQASDFEDPKKLASRLIHAVYLPMNFSGATRNEAENLASALGVQLRTIPIDPSFNAVLSGMKDLSPLDFDTTPLALQNLQARLRLAHCYLVAQALPIKLGIPGFFLVPATGNLSEVVRGYYTKFDNSSGDFSLLGSLRKTEVRALLKHFANKLPQIAKEIEAVLNLAPSAELLPKKEGKPQTDETDMGFLYDQLDFLIEQFIGRRTPYPELISLYSQRFNSDLEEAKKKVNSFYWHFINNRHKATTLPPAVHLTPLDLESTKIYLYAKEELAKGDPDRAAFNI